ncbi:MAG: tRNA (guanosine(37)-N1)-methyltransferase TrmD [Epsilonproteobacteria bacterium]|nr:tRNA (guanosine(37)-N1)-methyltransferase TrmD [Campylobacterota bacterium]
MKFVFVTLFPHLIQPYFEDGILKRAIDKQLFDVEFVNFRDYSTNKHKKIDAPAVGGGAGMVIEVDALHTALTHLKDKYPSSKIIFTTPQAKVFHQQDAKRLSHEEVIVLVSGRYEGFDERLIEEFADEVLSIGDFILSGGELASMVIADSIARNIPMVLGNQQSLETESFEGELLEAPTFTKKTSKTLTHNHIISEFFKGNHGIISSLKTELAIAKTKYHRPDIFKKYKTRKKYEK